MTDRQPAADGILTLENMNIGAADSCCGHPQQGIERTDIRYWFVANYPARLDENCCLHFGHALASSPS
jgi:hypothetical protein